MQRRDVINALRAFPWTAAPQSAVVDVVCHYAAKKPAVRMRANDFGGVEAITRWSRAHDVECVSDYDRFLCFSSTPGLAEEIMRVDQSNEKHERALGLLLGYPACCCDAVSQVGESEIDNFAAAVANWRFDSP